MAARRSATRWINPALLTLALGMAMLDGRGPAGSVLEPVHTFGNNLAGVLQSNGAVIARPVHTTVNTIINIPGQTSENKRLKAELAATKAQMLTERADFARTKELGSLLYAVSSGPFDVVPARMIARADAIGQEASITVDAGAADGVVVGQTVVASGGLVGRVATVADHTSVILLAVDPSFAVGVRVGTTSPVGVVRGTSTGGRVLPGRDIILELTMRDPDVRLAPGDVVTTAGLQAGSTFAGGIPIGTIARITNAPGAALRTAEVTPLVDFNALDILAIVTKTPPPFMQRMPGKPWPVLVPKVDKPKDMRPTAGGGKAGPGGKGSASKTSSTSSSTTTPRPAPTGPEPAAPAPTNPSPAEPAPTGDDTAPAPSTPAFTAEN